MPEKITKKRIEWNSQHSGPHEQEMEWIQEYLALPFEKKWAYLMSVCDQEASSESKKKGKRLEWI